MRTRLTADDLPELLEQPLLAVLATHRSDGSVLLSPVWHEWRDGGFSIVIEADDVKSRHIRRDPRVTVIVAEQAPPYRTLEVTGEAALSRPAEINRILDRIAVRYLGEANGRAYMEEMADFAGELLRLQPGRVRGWDYRDEVGGE
ncbi:MAG: TIGR03618 family F420-dependent PPOX class oxidoreductase [Gammaproteobacteria bacterium]|nr:TIGR03618 family F420-dependent PPOX class oxidoreductase [Gammaproteobacteria bacterium]MCP5201778.1 TIGR03618 family F420-dependent PPOX class oxidoreductase [Gammaproteobacteria bacterium]